MDFTFLVPWILEWPLILEVLWEYMLTKGMLFQLGIQEFVLDSFAPDIKEWFV